MSSEKPTPSDVRVCLDCGFAGPSSGSCPNHPGEPMFDPADPDIIAEMDARDSKRRDKTLTFWSLLGVAVGLAYAAPLTFIYFSNELEHTRTFVGIMGMMAAPAFGLGNWLGRKRFTPHFSRWLRDRSKDVNAADLKKVNEGKGYHLSDL